MATTTNYSWTTPDDTALVKDGAAAIRTLGSSIDTTTKALNPSTTLGDIEYRSSTANTNTRLAIGTSGQLLTVSGGVPAWTTVSTGGMTLLSTTTLSGASTTISSISGSYNNLEVHIYGITNATADGVLKISPNSDATITDGTGTQYQDGVSSAVFAFTGYIGNYSANWGRTNSNNSAVLRIYNYASTSDYKSITFQQGYMGTTSPQYVNLNTMGTIRTNSAITALKFENTGGNFSTGTVKIYGVK